MKYLKPIKIFESREDLSNVMDILKDLLDDDVISEILKPQIDWRGIILRSKIGILLNRINIDDLDKLENFNRRVNLLHGGINSLSLMSDCKFLFNETNLELIIKPNEKISTMLSKFDRRGDNSCHLNIPIESGLRQGVSAGTLFSISLSGPTWGWTNLFEINDDFSATLNLRFNDRSNNHMYGQHRKVILEVVKEEIGKGGFQFIREYENSGDFWFEFWTESIV
jgi:hypothetical protein